MKIAYIAGPVAGNADKKTIDLVARKNIQEAKKFAELLGNNLKKFFSPHLNDVKVTSKDVDTAQSFYYEQDTEFLIWICGAVIALPNWETSKGVKAEIELAKILDIPIFYPKKADINDFEIQKFIKWYEEATDNPEDYLHRANKVIEKWDEIIKIRSALAKTKVPDAA